MRSPVIRELTQTPSMGGVGEDVGAGGGVDVCWIGLVDGDGDGEASGEADGANAANEVDGDGVVRVDGEVDGAIDGCTETHPPRTAHVSNTAIARVFITRRSCHMTNNESTRRAAG